MLKMNNIKKTKNIYLSLFGYFLLYIFYYCVIASVALPWGISVAVITAIALVLVINSIRRREKKRGLSFADALGLKKVDLNFDNIKILALIGIGLNFVISAVLNLLPVGISQSYTESYTVVLKGDIISTIIMMAIVTPFLEEIFFRGIFQRRLMEELGVFKGFIIATCIFGFMHFNIIWTIYAAIIGFFLGGLYIKYNSVFPSAIVHSFFNLISCIPVFFMRFETIYKYTFGNKICVVLMLILGIGILWYVSSKTWIKMFFDKEFYQNDNEMITIFDDINSEENLNSEEMRDNDENI